jgi:hypothetical protein
MNQKQAAFSLLFFSTNETNVTDASIGAVNFRVPNDLKLF